jgi:hypothetical protein
MALYLVILSIQVIESRFFCDCNDTNNLDICLYNHNINDIRHTLHLLDYIIVDCSIISSIIYVLVAVYLVILSRKITETQFLGTTQLINNNFCSVWSFVTTLEDLLEYIVFEKILKFQAQTAAASHLTNL